MCKDYTRAHGVLLSEVRYITSHMLSGVVGAYGGYHGPATNVSEAVAEEDEETLTRAQQFYAPSA